MALNSKAKLLVPGEPDFCNFVENLFPRYLSGLILETELDNEEKFFQAGLEKYFRQVCL